MSILHLFAIHPGISSVQDGVDALLKAGTTSLLPPNTMATLQTLYDAKVLPEIESLHQKINALQTKAQTNGSVCGCWRVLGRGLFKSS
jgi:hypothetical protein